MTSYKKLSVNPEAIVRLAFAMLVHGLHSKPTVTGCLPLEIDAVLSAIVRSVSRRLRPGD